MPRFTPHLLQALQAALRARRRAANLRAGRAGLAGARGAAMHRPQSSAPAQPRRQRQWPWHGVALASLLLIGGGLIAGHARYLVQASAATPQASRQRQALEPFQPVLSGVRFAVAERAGIAISLHPEAALLILSGMQAAPAVHIDLCSQLRGPDDARLLPLRIGYRFEDVQQLVRHNQTAALPLALRNVLLVSAQGDAAGMPQVQISGKAGADFRDPASEPLQLSWQGNRADVRWLGDASFGQVEQGRKASVSLRQQGWLMWGEGAALHIERRSNVTCPQAGELSLQLYRTVAAPAQNGAARPALALVQAFPARGQPLASRLPAGVYQVPAAPSPALEDARLFADLQAHGLVRLNGQGSIELAPLDLLQWQALAPDQRVAGLQSWPLAARATAADASASTQESVTRKLLKRLYYQADGAYVRQQIDLFNSERWLLAWRSPLTEDGPWQASTVLPQQDGAVAVPLPSTQHMPLAASRLFADLPQGWQGWNRLAAWPASSQGPHKGQGQPLQSEAAYRANLQLVLPAPAQGGEQRRLMLIGQVQRVEGATIERLPACTGRACRSSGDVQQLVLSFLPGARTVRLEVAALPFQPAEERKYRHLWVEHGQLHWHALPLAAGRQPAAFAGLNSVTATGTLAGLQLSDRHGTPLWRDGATTEAAAQAGLAPLLGLAREHGSSVAGMLARLPQTPQQASLTLDLPLQALSQQVLDCVGLRRGRWQPDQCHAPRAVPQGRHAGLLILDAENGDILAAAGAGSGEVSAANWAEVRDFDRTSPARSPLRLPAWQHDGGAHRSPGSTFKVVTALGLEMAARKDSQLDAMLSGLPLPALNQLARQRGYSFQTDAASYPVTPRLAHVTNYREQSLERRAQDGRLGLAQALTYSVNTWFAWTGELSDRSLFGRAEGGAPDLQALDADALDSVRPIVAAAHKLGFEQSLRLDGGLLPADYDWRNWDALQASAAHIDPIHTRHELRQMSIGLRMQVTPLQMALASAALAQGSVVTPRLLLALDQRRSAAPVQPPLGIRLDRIRAGMKGVVDTGTGAGAFRQPALAALRPGLYGKTGTAPSGPDSATVWFTGWLEAGSLPGQTHRLAVAIFVSHSDVTGGEHAAPVLASILETLLAQAARKDEQKRN